MRHLTPRELDIAKLLAEGLSYQAIADMLTIGHGTVKCYALKLYRKFGLNSAWSRKQIRFIQAWHELHVGVSGSFARDCKTQKG